jgi:hypothetical protein
MYFHGFKSLDSTATSSSAPAAAKLNVVSLILGLIGFGTSLYALTLHLKAKTSAGSLGCDVNDLVNCSKVIGGEYGEFMTIPLGAYGMAYRHCRVHSPRFLSLIGFLDGALADVDCRGWCIRIVAFGLHFILQNSGCVSGV